MPSTLQEGHILLARGGGGGSGGGGGGGGGHGGGGGGGGSMINLVIFIIVLIVGYIATYVQQKRRQELNKKVVEDLKKLDPSWQPEKIIERTAELFTQFQQAWSTCDIAALPAILTEDFRKRIVLELGVLARQKRRNVMSNLRLTELVFTGYTDKEGDGEDSCVVNIFASATDQLLDTEKNKILYTDSEPFSEFWELKKEGGVWKLAGIRQMTENASMVEGEIKAFSDAHGFYFDPDFGWLMLPNKGVLFSSASFATSDVNNHVIGWYRDTIVEFYTFKASEKAPNYLIAQAILPVSYKNILVKRKKFLNWNPKGLRRIELESVDFNKRFCLWADPQDNVASLELLTPNFMERIYQLPFELNIEIVGQFLYFYTTERGAKNYPEMLQVLTWAFDEMKM